VLNCLAPEVGWRRQPYLAGACHERVIEYALIARAYIDWLSPYSMSLPGIFD
jgi:hypothetical protein